MPQITLLELRLLYHTCGINCVAIGKKLGSFFGGTKTESGAKEGDKDAAETVDMDNADEQKGGTKEKDEKQEESATNADEEKKAKDGKVSSILQRLVLSV